MHSPFPGMDPYLEDPDLWRDLHLTLIVNLRGVLNNKLPPGYSTSADRHIVIENPKSGKKKRRAPDVFVSKVKDHGVNPVEVSGGVLLAPQTITLPMTEHKGTPYLKITDRRSRRVVTVIELLSPTNKVPGKDRNVYLAKPQEYLDSQVNLVEINLLREGFPPPMGDRDLEELQYYFLIFRSWELPRGHLWPFTVRQPFPELPIPLKPDVEVTVNLRGCLDRAYQEARYDNDVNYARPPHPPLAGPDATWARNLLKKTR